MRVVVFVIFSILPLFGEVYKVGDYVFDFDSGWSSVKGSDPNSLLRIEKGSVYAEFIKLEDELSDFYIKSRIEQQRQQVEANAIKTSAVKTADIHSKSKAYYFTYLDKRESTVALFTYEGITYSFISDGISEDVFKKLIFTFRKDGEVIEIPKPKPKPKHKKVSAKKIEETNLDYISIADNIIASGTYLIDTSQPTTSEILASSKTVEIENIIPQISTPSPIKIEEQVQRKSLADRLTEYLITNRARNKMILNRKPIPPYIGLSIMVCYVLLCIFLRTKLNYSNLKLKPYPKDLPADFLFPFIITRLSTSSETLYQIVTRTGQFLSASFQHTYRRYFPKAIVWFLVFHILWSLSIFFDEKLFENIFLSLPFGNYLLSFIEIPFIAAYLFTLYHKNISTPKLVVKDSQMNDISSVIISQGYFIVKDAKGKDCLRVKKVGLWKRKFVFIDEDNRQFMEVRDYYPQIWKWVRLLGNFILKKRCYYSIHNEKGDMIGFLFLDPSNFNSYQIHFDFDYMRLVNSIQLVASILMIISTEREENILVL